MLPAAPWCCGGARRWCLRRTSPAIGATSACADGEQPGTGAGWQPRRVIGEQQSRWCRRPGARHAKHGRQGAGVAGRANRCAGDNERFGGAPARPEYAIFCVHRRRGRFPAGTRRPIDPGPTPPCRRDSPHRAVRGISKTVRRRHDGRNADRATTAANHEPTCSASPAVSGAAAAERHLRQERRPNANRVRADSRCRADVTPRVWAEAAAHDAETNGTTDSENKGGTEERVGVDRATSGNGS